MQLGWGHRYGLAATCSIMHASHRPLNQHEVVLFAGPFPDGLARPSSTRKRTLTYLDISNNNLGSVIPLYEARHLATPVWLKRCALWCLTG